MLIQFWNLKLISKKRGKAVKISLNLGLNFMGERLFKGYFYSFQHIF